MADEQKFADEMLSDEELDLIVGGTRAETYELAVTFYKAYYKVDISGVVKNKTAENYMGLKTDMEEELGKLGITANLDVGKGGTGFGEKANQYFSKNGKAITHEQLMNVFRKYI